MSATDPTPEDRAHLDHLMRGFQISRMLRLVADIGVGDRIAAASSVDIDELAAACAAQPQPLLRVLRALASVGVFAVQGRMVSHTPRSLLLRQDTAASMYHPARFWTASGSWAAWDRLDVALQGDVPHVAAWGSDRFSYLRTHPDEARAFDAMMAQFPDDRHAALADAYDFSHARAIADIGGGRGTTLRHILQRNTTASGILLERPDVIASLTAQDTLNGRITAIGGDFFQHCPRDADTYLMIRVLHNWADPDCLRILRTCRAAMSSHAILLIGDQIIDPDPQPSAAMQYLMDVQMMAMFGGARERTAEEFKVLLDQTGFVMRGIITTQSPVRIIEAVPAA